MVPPAVGTIHVVAPASSPSNSPADPLDAYGDEARCRLLDELEARVEVRRPRGDGVVFGDRVCTPRDVKVEPGEYRVTVKAKCQPDREYTLQVGEDGARVDTRVGAPEPRRAFVNVKREPVLVVPFGERQAVKPSAKAPGYLPENTEVEVVRMLSLSGFGPDCNMAVVRLIDFGYEDVGADDRFFLVPARNLAEKPSDSLSAAEHFKADQDKADAHDDAVKEVARKRRESALAASKREVEAGKCEGDRYQFLVDQLPAARSFGTTRVNIYGETQGLEFVGHDVVVATPDGTKLNLKSWLGGELHVFAISLGEVSLEARDGRDYEIKKRSDQPLRGYLSRELSSDATWDSRVIQANAGDAVKLTAKGSGCTLVVAFRGK